jgi:ferredoxin
MNLNDLTRPHDIHLAENAVLFSNKKSISKRSYPDGKHFSPGDIVKLFGKFGYMLKSMGSLQSNLRLIKRKTNFSRNSITSENWKKLEIRMRQLGVDSYGWLRLDEEDVYQGKGIPYTHALIITINMDAKIFKTVPSMDGQLEVMRVYGETGEAVNQISRLLRKLHYNAVPNHSMGGAIDYAKAGVKAGIGAMGRHGMLITPEAGACHRSAIVYTDIKNLGDYIPPQEDHSWVSEFCAHCGKCIRSCPTGAIYENPEEDEYGNVSAVEYEKCSAGFAEYGCGICIRACPFTSVGYEKLKAAHVRRMGET